MLLERSSECCSNEKVISQQNCCSHVARKNPAKRTLVRINGH